MANCPQCNSKIPFRKTAFLSRRKNTLRCSSCQTELVADKQVLSNIGSLGGVVAGVFSYAMVMALFNGSAKWPLYLLILLLVLSITALVQSKVIKFTLKEN